MKKLSIEQKLETLNKAIDLNLKQDFIDLLVNELARKRCMINLQKKLTPKSTGSTFFSMQLYLVFRNSFLCSPSHNNGG
jgi:hypothetical protein